MGEGHNSAAKALLEYFTLQHVECEMLDTLSLVSQQVSQTAADLYVFTTKSSLFEMLYKAGSLITNPKVKSPVYMGNKLYCEKLHRYIMDNHFDTIICTHLFPAEALTALRRAKEPPRKTLFVMTDYTCIPFVEETQLDAYIVPHEHLIEECVSRGLPRTKLYPYGIPVRQAFYSKQSRDTARTECRQLFGDHLDPSQPWMLVMSGSMGFGNIQALVKELLNSCKENIRLFLVCGNNENLRETLTDEFGSNPQLSILGFTDRISTLMDACDVLFTKPGGLSSTEAAAKNIPMIHTAPIPGCETQNAHFFLYHNMAYSSTDVKEQVRRALLLCHNPAYRGAMQLSQHANINYNCCRDILELARKEG